MNRLLDIIYIPFGYVMQFFYNITGNYGLALLLFAVAVKILFLPFAIKQQKTSIQGAKLRPKLMAIEKKYAGRKDQATLQKKQQEIMELQQAEGYSPLSGCLPLLIQLPIIMALYEIVRNPLTYICRFSSDVITGLVDTVNRLVPETFKTGAKVDQITLINKVKELGTENFESVEGFLADKIPNFDLFPGFDLSLTPTVASVLVVIPILVFASQFFSMKLSRKLNPLPQAQTEDASVAMSNKIMDWSMPLMTLFFAFNMSASIGLYWIYQSLVTMLQMVILSKLLPMPKFSEEELKEAMKQIKGSGAKKTPVHTHADDPDYVRPVSLHHIDDDEDDVPAPTPKKQNAKKNTVVAQAPIKDESDKKQPQAQEARSEQANESAEAETDTEASDRTATSNDDTTTENK